MDFVADTNFWYDLASGVLSPSRFAACQVFATPASFLELCSRISPLTFAARREAARAVVTYAAGVLPDSETHLARIWGVSRAPSAVFNKASFEILATSSSPAAPSLGVPVFAGSTVGRIDTALATAWRGTHWLDFRDRIVDAIDADVPNYRKRREEGRIKYLPGNQQAQFKVRIRSQGFRDAIVFGTYLRVLMSEGKAPAMPSKQQFASATKDLTFYSKIYAEYIIGCACRFAPDFNDFGDLEGCLYLQEGRRLLTSDRRWLDLAKAVSIEPLVADPKTL